MAWLGRCRTAGRPAASRARRRGGGPRRPLQRCAADGRTDCAGHRALRPRCAEISIQCGDCGTHCALHIGWGRESSRDRDMKSIERKCGRLACSMRGRRRFRHIGANPDICRNRHSACSIATRRDVARFLRWRTAHVRMPRGSYFPMRGASSCPGDAAPCAAVGRFYNRRHQPLALRMPG